MELDSAEVTALLHRSARDEDARDRVYDMVYSDLRRIAGRELGARAVDQTLSVTALVNQAYLKLCERTGRSWNDRAHFLRVAAKAMRHINVDYARARLTKKRGEGQSALPLIEDQAAAQKKSEMVVALEDALTDLEGDEPRLVSVVECRFFAGLTDSETADALGLSRSTVQRDWLRARDWLKDYLTQT